MDCIAAASDLRELLIAHSGAQKQVSVLGKYIIYVLIYMYTLSGEETLSKYPPVPRKRVFSDPFQKRFA